MNGDDGLLLPIGTAVLGAMLASRQEPNSGALAQEAADAVLALPEVAALRAKAAAADRVRELHRRTTFAGIADCDACAFPWPCRTIRALDGDGS